MITKYEYIENYPTKEYTDVNIAFTRNPNTEDVTKKKNEDAINQALRSLILLGRSEKPFHPEVGGDIHSMLFENVDEVGTETLLQTKIARIIRNNEPRVELQAVNVEFLNDNNAISIEIYYTILTTLKQSSTNIYLKVAR